MGISPTLTARLLGGPTPPCGLTTACIETSIPGGPIQIESSACRVSSLPRPYRRHGLAATLLDRVIDDAADRGAKWVEGYPYTEPDGDDPSHYRGPKHIYRDRGFEEVEQHDGYLVMRRAT